MAETKLVADLDKKLMEEGIIDPSFMEDYKKVHAMLNTLEKPAEYFPKRPSGKGIRNS